MPTPIDNFSTKFIAFLEKRHKFLLKAYEMNFESLKNTFILPFISLLDYDVFDPFEVSPGGPIKTRNRVANDHYILYKDGVATMVVCYSEWSADSCVSSSDKEGETLKKYMDLAKVRMGCLISPELFSFRCYEKIGDRDLLRLKNISMNTLDMEYSAYVYYNEISSYAQESMQFIYLLTKGQFDIESIISKVHILNLKFLIHKDLSNPSVDFVKYYVSRLYKEIYHKSLPEERLEDFTDYVQRALHLI